METGNFSKHWKGIMATVIAGVIASVLSAGVGMYDDVHANTLYREATAPKVDYVYESVIRLEEGQKMTNMRLDIIISHLNDGKL